MTTPTNAALAAQVSTILTRVNNWQAQLADWLAGVPGGGPNGDGRFPLTSASGDTALYLSLPAIQDLVSGPAAIAVEAKTGADAAATLANNHRMNAETAKTAAEVAKAAAQQLRQETEVFRNDVAANWANVNVKAGEVATHHSTVVAKAAEVDLDAIGAEEARVQAIAAADRAATFDPALYLPVSQKGQPNGLATLNSAGKLPNSMIPAVSLIDTYVRDSEAQQLGLMVEQGDVCVRSDLRKSFIYKGPNNNSMSAWQELLSPLSEVLSVNGRVGAVDLTDLFAPAVHSHSWDVITGKPSAFTPAAHTHVIADVAGLQGALDGKQPSGSYAASNHTHSYLPLAGGSLSGGLTMAGAGEQIIGFNTAGSYLYGNSGGMGFYCSATSKHLKWDRTNGQLDVQALTVNGRNVLNDIDGKAAASHGHLVTDLPLASQANAFEGLAYVAHDGVMEIGRYIDFHNADNDGTDFKVRLDADGNILRVAAAGGLTVNGVAVADVNHTHSGYLSTSGGTVSSLLVTGIFEVNGTQYLKGIAPTQWFVDTDHRSFGIHVNDNTMYFMRGGANSPSWTTLANGSWPAQMNLDSGWFQFGGPVNMLDGLTVNGRNVLADIDARIYRAGDGVINTLCYWKSTGSVNSAGANLQVAGDVSNGAVMSFHRFGVYAINFGLDTDHVVRLGGWSSPERVAFHPDYRLISRSDYTTYQSPAHIFTNPNGTTLFQTGTEDGVPYAAIGGGGVLRWGDGRATGGRLTISGAGPSGGRSGDVWFKV